MLQIAGVTKILGAKRVLDNVDVTVDKGSFLTLLGPSGCGKTTLLRIIAGFLAPNSGSILLDGKRISSAENVVPPEARGMGMVFQNYAVWPHMSVLNNVAYGMRVRRVPAAERRDRSLEALRLVNLLGFENRLPSELSGGQQQRVSIARSVVTAPSVLLLDEPLSNLDAKLRKEMLFDLKQIQQKSGITFVYVTHDQSEALSVSDRIVVMNEGRVEQAGTPSEVYDNPKNLFVASFVGSANTINAVVESAGPSGMVVSWGKGARLTLRDVKNHPVGANVQVAFKRHAVSIGTSQAGDLLAMTGEVKRSYFLGQADELCVDVDGQELFAFAPPRMHAVGASVTLQIPAGACQVFAAAERAESDAA